MVTYLGSLFQSCYGEVGTLQKNITGICVECSQCLGHTDLSPLMACVLSHSTLLRFQVALQGNCLRRALGCVHFPGLSHSGSGSLVLHKSTDSSGPEFVPFPGPSSSGYQVLGECPFPRWGSASYHLPGPSHSVSWVHRESPISGLPHVSSGELISGCDPPGRC